MKRFLNEETIKLTLILAGIYNLLLAAIFFLKPGIILSLLNYPTPYSYIELWQLIGMFLGVFGLGFFLASTDLESHWGIILLSFIVKIFSAIFLLKAIVWGSLPSQFLFFVVINDLIWLIPFYLVLNLAYESNIQEESLPKKFSDLVSVAKTNDGKTLLELSRDSRVLLVFVRHLGCTFCRETVHEISKLESVIHDKKLKLVFVHMSDPAYGDEFFSKYYQSSVSHISDPQRLLYQSLGLRRGSLSQIFGPSTFIRGFWAGMIKGHGLGKPEGDPMQLGGFFIISEGRIVFEYKTTKASDAFDPNIIPEL
jgi:peroxiredoxin